MSEDGVEELVLKVGALEIQVRARGNQGTSSTHPPTEASVPLAGPRAVQSQLGPGPSESEFTVVGHAPWSAAWKRQLLSSEVPGDFLEVDLSPVEHLSDQLDSIGDWTGLARVGRALRAGISAADCLADRTKFVVRSPRIPERARIYVVLRAAPGKPIGWTDRSKLYWNSVGGKEHAHHPDSVSHSFASKSEAIAYCIGAGRSWPALQQLAD